jgi:hypothetical protein
VTAPPVAHHLDLPSVRLLPAAGSPTRRVGADRARRFGQPAGRAAPRAVRPALDETLAAEPGLDRELTLAARDLAARAYPAERVTGRQSARWIDHHARDQHHARWWRCTSSTCGFRTTAWR